MFGGADAGDCLALWFAGFLGWERRAPAPMVELSFFARRSFSVGNAQRFAMYAGLSILFFSLVILPQEVAGYSAIKAGLTTLPVTLVMFALSRRFGALADRYAPRVSTACGPVVLAVEPAPAHPRQRS